MALFLYANIVIYLLCIPKFYAHSTGSPCNSTKTKNVINNHDIKIVIPTISTYLY